MTAFPLCRFANGLSEIRGGIGTAVTAMGTNATMIPNSELSALVAEKVMGWTRTRNANEEVGGTVWRAPNWQAYLDRYPDFATDNGLALVAALKGGTCIEIAPQSRGGACVWDYKPTGPGVYGATVARALCFAALRAAGVEVQDDRGEG